MSTPDGPRRIRLQRTRGWRLPPDTVVVSRPTRWGNPFIVGTPGIDDRAESPMRSSRATHANCCAGGTSAAGACSAIRAMRTCCSSSPIATKQMRTRPRIQAEL
jgi:hypothetical protein